MATNDPPGDAGCGALEVLAARPGEVVVVLPLGDVLDVPGSLVAVLAVPAPIGLVVLEVVAATPGSVVPAVAALVVVVAESVVALVALDVVVEEPSLVAVTADVGLDPVLRDALGDGDAPDGDAVEAWAAPTGSDRFTSASSAAKAIGTRTVLRRRRGGRGGCGCGTRMVGLTGPLPRRPSPDGTARVRANPEHRHSGAQAGEQRLVGASAPAPF